MHFLEEQFRQYVGRKNWFSNGETTLLAVSGGVDSMVMADLFLQLKVPFIVAHCNYRLRADEADADEALVAGWCRKNAVPFFSTGFDTATIAESWKKGIQETARILRYEWLDELRVQHGCKWLATAHHADDNVETMLMHLFKGTGIAGMHGIPERNGSVVRPLYFATKADVLAYAAEQGVDYREDASNAKDIYSRNAIRNRILPLVEEHFPGATTQMHETVNRLKQAEQLYREAVELKRKKLVEQRGVDVYVPVLKLRKAEPLETLVYELFAPYGFSTAQVPHIIHLLDAESGRLLSSATHRIIRHRDFLVVTRLSPGQADMLPVEALPAVVHTPEGSFHLKLEPRPEQLPEDPWTACIDATALGFPLVFRRARTGDYFYPLGMGRKKKKLSRYLIDRKLGKHEKEKVWVLESNRRIAWVAGMRLDERFKVVPGTQQVLMITFQKPRDAAFDK